VTETLRLRAGVLEWREIEGEIVAVDTRTSTYVAVNRAGATLWPALVRGATRDDLAAILTNEFKVDRASANTDVDAFIGMLAEQRLLDA
jgi:Coenzyme PQQ synthesis protein D (PqqD)